jgi:hypothetical protein
MALRTPIKSFLYTDRITPCTMRRITAALSNKESGPSILSKDSATLGKLSCKTPDSPRPPDIVAIGDQRASHAREAAWLPFLAAIEEVVARLKLERPVPIEHRGFR